MASVGHKLSQTPQKVQEFKSVAWGLPLAPTSNTPNGQTPTQMSVGQGGHFASSTTTFGFCFPMASQQLNKPLEYICCALG
jgi:hypothetical protein